jgi:hypothetical protein
LRSPVPSTLATYSAAASSTQATRSPSGETEALATAALRGISAPRRGAPLPVQLNSRVVSPTAPGTGP